jgi:hypothetical protein
MGHKTVLMHQEMAGLQKAVEVATEVKSQKRRYIKTAETLTVGEIAELMAKKEGGGQEEDREPVKRVRAQRCCGHCSKTGHNARTCAVVIVDPSDSDESE